MIESIRYIHVDLSHSFISAGLYNERMSCLRHRYLSNASKGNILHEEIDIPRKPTHIFGPETI